jgi:hypothetical protein
MANSRYSTLTLPPKQSQERAGKADDHPYRTRYEYCFQHRPRRTIRVSLLVRVFTIRCDSIPEVTRCQTICLGRGN